MKIVEAIAYMMKGVKMTHRWFDPNEWVIIDNGDFLFEDGVRCPPELFWFDRLDPSWETDWDFYKE